MKKIRNYNPNLGLTLSDLRLINDLGAEKEHRIIDAIRTSVAFKTDLSNSKFYFKGDDENAVYKHLIGKILEQVENYDEYLIEKCGYSQFDVDACHGAKVLGVSDK